MTRTRAAVTILAGLGTAGLVAQTLTTQRPLAPLGLSVGGCGRGGPGPGRPVVPGRSGAGQRARGRSRRAAVRAVAFTAAVAGGRRDLVGTARVTIGVGLHLAITAAVVFALQVVAFFLGR